MIRKINQPDTPYYHRHIEDVERIQQVCLKNGYAADLEDCAGIWSEYSDSYAAGWLGLDEDDDDLWRTIKNYVETYAE